MKLLSSFIFIHLKMFFWYFLGATIVGFIASTVVKIHNAGISFTTLLPFSQFFK